MVRSHLVVPASVTERHPNDTLGPLEPAHRPEHRGRIGRETSAREARLELVERPAVPTRTAHDLERLFGDQRAPGHASEYNRKLLAQVHCANDHRTGMDHWPGRTVTFAGEGRAALAVE